MVCKDKVTEEVDVKGKWGDEQQQKVHQYGYLGVDFSNDWKLDC